MTELEVLARLEGLVFEAVMASINTVARSLPSKKGLEWPGLSPGHNVCNVSWYEHDVQVCQTGQQECSK
ncbi:hypothetical protein KO508_18040 [Marinobacter salexigens]|uniref:Uncharacterized protein n=1 Tax=Marinobacter salexigens TaxID=1925763 RepID=A0ABS6ADT0_9GAMM|nr:hypothetical protein [Marinobacter salexigens]